MSAPIYVVNTGGAVALSGTVARSILAIRAGAAFGLLLKEASVSFDGITAGNVPVLIELMYATFATNPPGTNSAAVTPIQTSGRVLAHGMTAGKAWTAGNEPTALTLLRELTIHPQAGITYQIPLGDEFDTDFLHAFLFRLTATQNVNARGYLSVQRA